MLCPTSCIMKSFHHTKYSYLCLVTKPIIVQCVLMLDDLWFTNQMKR